MTDKKLFFRYLDVIYQLQRLPQLILPHHGGLGSAITDTLSDLRKSTEGLLSIDAIGSPDDQELRDLIWQWRDEHEKAKS